jgi:hypothetical protein
MTDPIEVKNCTDDEVFSFEDQTCKFNRFKQAVWEYFSSNSNNYINYISEKLNINRLNISSAHGRGTHNAQWFLEGKECEVLRPYKGWQKGKIKINLTIEFIPDEPEPLEENGHQESENSTESPLDEIRQQLSENN